MGRRRGLAKFKVAQMTSTRPVVEKKPVERSVILGTPENRKTIFVMIGVGTVLLALVFWIIAKNLDPFPWPALVFVALHGGLLAMLLGQLMLVYPDRVIVVFTLMAALMGEVLYIVATGRAENFNFTFVELRDMSAIFFWAGWLGFWGGFIMFAKREKKRQLFLQRMQKAKDDLPDIPDGEPSQPQT